MTTTAALVELLADEFGTFADGYTSEDVDRVLGAVAAAAGLPLVCVWEYVDHIATGGSSDLGVVVDGQVRRVVPLWGHLTGHGAPSDLISAVRAGGPDALVGGEVVDVVADPLVNALTRVTGRNFAGEDLRPQPTR